MDIRRTAFSALLGLLLAGPALADALYPTKQEMLLLTRRVAALERSTNQPGPVLKADAPSGNVESITNYSTLYFKPRDYAAFRLTNSGTEAHLQVSVNGDFLLSSNVPAAGQMLYASGASHTSLYWKSSLLGHVTNVDVRASDADLGYVAGGTFVMEWNTNAVPPESDPLFASWVSTNGGTFGGIDVGLLNSNFYLTYTNFLSVSNVVNSNAWITYSNAVANNSNFQSRVADMMVGLLGSGGSYGFFTNEAAYRSDMSNFFFRNYTNIALFTNGSFAAYGSFSNIVYPISTNVAGIWLDIGLLNTNFLLISNDFCVLSNYLLGGGTTNSFGTNSWSADGSSTNAALVPALQYNQGLYQTNFMQVNTNTWLTTNLFALLGDMLEIPTNSFLPEDSETSYREAYDAWVTNFLWMETDLSALPTNLNLSFPGLFELFDGTTVQPGISSLRDEVYAVLAELGLSSFKAFGYLGTVDSYTNSTQTYVVPTNCPANSIIKIYAWGGGGAGNDSGDGGFSYGGFIVTNAETFNEALPECVTNGMVLKVQVGTSFQRAAVWRSPDNPGITNFASYTNELIVAGGGGRGGGAGGFGGGTYGGPGSSSGSTGGGGGTQVAGGTAGSGGGPGDRVFGSRSGDRYGGDGYYGGGSVSGAYLSGGGGGSGFIHDSMANLVAGGGTYAGVSSGPIGTEYAPYGGNAGVRGPAWGYGAAARVAFEIPLSGE